MNGGLNIFINLLLNKELSQKRESGRHQCLDCGKEYNKTDLHYKNENINWNSYYPKNNYCDSCGSHKIEKVAEENSFEEKWDNYEETAEKILPFYQHLVLFCFKN